MKNLKKISALFVAIVMTMITVVPAFAEENGPTSQIQSNIPGHDLVAYQIFVGDASHEEKKSILSNIGWGENIDSIGFINALNAKFEDWNLLESSSANEVAKKLENLTVEEANKVAQIAFENRKGLGTKLNNPGSTNVRQGYYLIVDETNNLEAGDALNPAILAVNGNVSVKDKKEKVAVDKTVKNETDSDFSDGTTSSIGKKVTFKLHTKIIDQTALSNYEKYFLQFSDTASNALDPVVDENQKVAFKAYLSSDDELDVVKDDDITSWFEASEVTFTKEEKRVFTFTAEDIKGKGNDPAGKHIFITYEAKLNGNAVIGNPGNENEVVLNYSNNPNSNGEGIPPYGTTPPDNAIVFTFQLNGTKVALGDPNIKLKGAEFVVYRVNESGEKEYAVMDENKKIIQWEILDEEELKEKIADNAPDRENYLLISKEEGIFGIQGLGDGTYYLKETKAPNGYNLITEPIQFKISSTIEPEGTIKDISIEIAGKDPASGNASDGSVTVTVENTKGTTLPETGGMGTTMLYVVGGILLVGSAVLLVTKKRMGHEG